MLEQVISFLNEYTRINKEAITYESNLVVDLGLTSFDIVEMSSQLEEKFNLEIHDDDLILFRNVGDISDYIKEQLPKQ